MFLLIWHVWDVLLGFVHRESLGLIDASRRFVRVDFGRLVAAAEGPEASRRKNTSVLLHIPRQRSFLCRVDINRRG